MDPGPLVMEQIEAGTTFLAALKETVPVTSAFWLKRPDRDSWEFCVVADRGRETTGGEVLRVALELRDPNLPFLGVRTIDPDDPLARSALDFQRLYPGKAVRLRDRVFGNMGIDEVYLYPSPVAVS